MSNQLLISAILVIIHIIIGGIITGIHRGSSRGSFHRTDQLLFVVFTGNGSMCLPSSELFIFSLRRLRRDRTGGEFFPSPGNLRNKVFPHGNGSGHNAHRVSGKYDNVLSAGCEQNAFGKSLTGGEEDRTAKGRKTQTFDLVVAKP